MWCAWGFREAGGEKGESEWSATIYFISMGRKMSHLQWTEVNTLYNSL